MSITKISVTKNLTGSINYVVYGNGEKYQKNKQNHTTRAVAVTCTMQGGIKQFLKFGNDIKRKNSKIKNVGYNIIQSFNDKQFDYKNPRDARIVNGLGIELAKRLFPNSAVLCITHNDGKNHHLHNHLIILNYDLQTGKAIRKGRGIRKIRAVNDKLMRENSLDTVTYGRNFDKEINSQFDLLLISNIRDAQKSSTDFSQFSNLLKARGIKVSVKGQQGTKKGLVYSMMDEHATRKNKETGKVESHPRPRRRKASRLGKEFTYDALQTQFILNRKKKEHDRQIHLQEIKKMMAERTRRQKRLEVSESLEDADNHSEKREKSDRKEVQNQTIIRRVHIDDAESALTDNTKSNDRQALEELSDLGEVSSSKTATRKRSPRPQRDKKIETKTTAKNQRKKQYNRKKHEKIQLPTADDILLAINNEQQKKHDDFKQF